MPLLSDFDFALPPELIAQYPAPAREDARLMVLRSRERRIELADFPDITNYFTAGDLLVINDTRVIPARLQGTKETGGKVEVFLVQRHPGSSEIWDCLTRAAKPVRIGSLLQLGEIVGEVLAPGEGSSWTIGFRCDGDFTEALERTGRIPLPPYIRREAGPLDRERYQTVFASSPGAVAAPTAGLHFTGRTFTTLRERGVEVFPLTLHVGLGTFLPVRTDDLRDHRMHGESFTIPEATAMAINRAKDAGRRVFALGTTAARTLEYAVAEDGRVKSGDGITDLFIYPGFRFRVIDALITNFHLPRSTLLMLVAAFAGRDFILEAYQRAVREQFRFFSYGDCMLIV